jgi:peptidoglycan/xylan/chitin deacetylase (PgdA/CDA1 family)
LFRLHDLTHYFKKYRSRFLLGWNIFLTSAILAAILFWIFPWININNTNRQIAKDQRGNYSVVNRTKFNVDSIPFAKLNPRTENVQNRYFDFSLPMKKGWIINVWQNNWPVLSKSVMDNGNSIFPIQLDNGKNILRVAVWDQSQQLVYADQYQINYDGPNRNILRKSIERGNYANKELALTFDGGSNAAGAELILKSLREYNIKTTMFITGQFINKFPEIVLEMVGDGHEIGNHTYSHPHLTTYMKNGRQEVLSGVNREFIIYQLFTTDSLFFHLTDKHLSPYWRAPYGEYNQQLLDWAAEAGYRHVRWTQGFDTFDWVEDNESPIYKSSQEILEGIVEKDSGDRRLNGAIVLMHLGSTRSEDPVYQIIPNLINELHSRGYAVVPISNLLNP